MAVSLLMLAISNPVLASVDPDDVFGSEKECAEKFDPEYDRENYLGCTWWNRNSKSCSGR